MRIKKFIFFLLIILLCNGCTADKNANLDQTEGINLSQNNNEDMDDYEAVAEYGNLTGNIVNGGYIMAYQNDIFFAYEPMSLDGALFRYDLTSFETEFITNNCYGSLNIRDNRLFYANQADIFCCDLNGENIEQYYHSQSSQCSFIIYDNFIYLIDVYI